MSNGLVLSLTVVLCMNADVPRVNSLRPPINSPLSFPANTEISLFPEGSAPASETDQQSSTPATAGSSHAASNGPLKEESKLTLIRYVSGEFAKAIKPLPAGKEGFIFNVAKPLNTNLLDSAVATHGAAINTGDRVQITKLEFRDHQIVVDVNGGGRGKHHWRDHLQVGIGGMPTGPTAASTPEETGPPGIQPGLGSTLFLEFNKTLPDMTPEDLKHLLSPIMDFTKQRSASVQWVDTLPAEMKKAIQDRKPLVGMDREEVVAAVGKPDHKVRERDPNGNDIEDWIYGQPPSKTVFVRFSGERVTSIKQFPQ
jgi:hypothetical protein